MPAPVFGVIAPHPPIMVSTVGGSRSEVTRASLDALAQAAEALANYAPDLVCIMSPHAPGVADAIAVDDSATHEGTLGQFGDSTVRRFDGDPEFARALVRELEARGLPAVARASEPKLRPGWLDHGVLVPMHFLDPMCRYPLVVLSLSYLPYAEHRGIGEAVTAAAMALGRRIAFIASGDLSHRLTPEAPAGYSPRATALDAAIVDIVERGALSELSAIDEALVDAGGECGLRSFIALSGYAGDQTETRVLAYEGPWGVGYLTALVGAAALEACDTRALSTAERGSKGGMAGSDESEIVVLARRAIEAHVRGEEAPAGVTLDDDEYPLRAGAFVSLHREERLRGCIGTVLPTEQTLAEEVAKNAVQAATRDPRFPPLHADELHDLDIKVDVLHAPEACSLEQLDPRRYGVIASSGWRRGLLLPDLEGVEDVETQVAVALSKAGIRPGEPCSYERFRVDRYT